MSAGGSSSPAHAQDAFTGTGQHDDLSRQFAMTTRLDAVVRWGQRNSLWPLAYGTACCGIELMSVMGPKYDLARFGAEVVRFSPRQSDLLIVAGTITEKNGSHFSAYLSSNVRAKVCDFHGSLRLLGRILPRLSCPARY